MYSYSLIIPVYNRPDEVHELLESLTLQTYKNFEVVLVEDGSTLLCKDVADKYADKLDIKYIFQKNTGCAVAKNNGVAQLASKDFVISTDSDCIFPPQYFQVVDGYLANNYLDCFGGPDAAHESFSTLQKATNYSMTSFFTTGGTRGKEKSLAGGKYYPRGFNMGVKREAFLKAGGFGRCVPGEDIYLASKLYENNYKVGFIGDAFVYHKRRTTMKSFFRQLYGFGRSRYNLYLVSPETVKIVHILPALFTIGVAFLLISSFICPYALLPIALYSLMIFIDSSIKNSKISIGFLSIFTSFVQLFGHGLGFMREFIFRSILRKAPDKRFQMS